MVVGVGPGIVVDVGRALACCKVNGGGVGAALRLRGAFYGSGVAGVVGVGWGSLVLPCIESVGNKVAVVVADGMSALA